MKKNKKEETGCNNPHPGQEEESANGINTFVKTFRKIAASVYGPDD